MPGEYLNAKGEYCWAKSRLMRRAGKQAALSATSRHFTTPSRDFALIARKLTGVFNFIAALEAEFNAHDMVQSHISRWRRGKHVARKDKGKDDDNPGHTHLAGGTLRAYGTHGRRRCRRHAGGGTRQLRAGNRPSARDMLLTPGNARRVAEQLSTMRGAAMKVGQMLSMDTRRVPAPGTGRYSGATA